MNRKFRLIMIMALLVGLMGGLTTSDPVSADPQADTVVAIPQIDLGDVFKTGISDWETTIQIQNMGGSGTGVVVYFWPDYDGTCPSNDPGPCGHACMYVPENGVWTLQNQIPNCAYSAIVYSVAADDFQDACSDASNSTPGWRNWVGEYARTGEPLAVTADRIGTGPFGDFTMASSVRGISDDMHELGPPYAYYSPYIMHGYNELDTTILIQNMGAVCASIWLYYKEQGFCESQIAQHVEAIAPGQAIRIGPGPDAHMRFPTTIGRPWLGSAYVTANVPLAVVVDQLSHAPSVNRGKLLTYRTMPYRQTEERTWYAGLIYRGISGWNSGIQVQNLTQQSLPTFVTVEFFDESGGSILFLGDWICRNGASTFYLPAITDLGVNFPFGYVGAAEIQSHRQVDYPGGPHEGEPIFAVVDLKKEMVYGASLGDWRHTVAGETQGGAYTTHPDYEVRNAWGWAMPFIAKEQEGVTSRIAIRNNSNCTKINGSILIKDETGEVVATIPVAWLHPKHMEIFDLAYLGQIARGFVGVAEFRVLGVEQLCDTDGNGLKDIEPVMPSVIVLNYGFDKELPVGGGAGPITDREGDLTRVYEAIPYNFQYSPCIVTFSGHVIDEVTLEPLYRTGSDAVTVSVGGVSDQTDSTGYYEIDYVRKPRLTESETVTLSVVKTGYEPWSKEFTITCDDVVENPELDPECESVKLEGTVFDKETGEVIPDAYVTVTNGDGTVEFKDTASTTDANGKYSYTDIPFDPNDTYKLCAGKYDSSGLRDYREHCLSVYIPECGGFAVTDFELHDEPRSKVLLFFGNGGVGPDGSAQYNYNQLAANYGPDPGKGYIVKYTNAWPGDPDLDEYKLIVLILPGNADDDIPDNGFTEAQLSQLGLFISHGGRVVLLTEHEDDWAPATDTYVVQNDLLDRLSIGINITNISDTVTTYDREITPAPYNSEFTPEQLEGGGVGTGYQQLVVSGGAFKLYDDVLGAGGDIVIAADKVGSAPNNWPDETECTGWDVIVVGDAEILDDQHLAGGWPENEAFALSLISFPTGAGCP